MKQQLKALLVEDGDSFIKHNSKVEWQIGTSRWLPNSGIEKFDGTNMAFETTR